MKYTSPYPYRYLIKQEGVWYIVSTSVKSHWHESVTDVIWLRGPDMVANWRQKKDGYKLNRNEIVKDKELTFYLLQVKPR